MPQEMRFYFCQGLFFSTTKQSFQGLSHIQRMKCFCLLPRYHPEDDSLNPSLRLNDSTIKQLLLPLTGEKHLGCNSSPNSFNMWANTQKEQLLFCSCSHSTDCSALTKLAVTALPGVPHVWQHDGEGVCNKKCNDFHHRVPFNCFATKLNIGIYGKISQSVYFKEIFLEHVF